MKKHLHVQALGMNCGFEVHDESEKEITSRSATTSSGSTGWNSPGGVAPEGHGSDPAGSA